MNPVYVNSKITGGHYAFQTEGSKKPFENPMSIYSKIKLNNMDIIADIGAYVGEYSLFAIKNGVKHVFSYEPTPETFKVLEMNKKENMTIFNKAVVGDDKEFVELFISKGIGVTNSIVKTHRKKESFKVPTIKYEDAVKDATIVKIDVEGAEYDYKIIQPQLRAIILEFHPLVKEPWKEYAEKIMNEIESAGYNRIVKPNFKSGWNLTGCWSK
ncbi:MAG TPA: FkbM family methyltransferase [Caldisericia bacterium]|nr:FkbM family methyltransferase [Caldisericia bacterium]